MGKKCTHCDIGKKLKIFTKSIRNVRLVIVIEVQDVTLRIKINYQINESYIMK